MSGAGARTSAGQIGNGPRLSVPLWREQCDRISSARLTLLVGDGFQLGGGGEEKRTSTARAWMDFALSVAAAAAAASQRGNALYLLQKGLG